MSQVQKTQICSNGMDVLGSNLWIMQIFCCLHMILFTRNTRGILKMVPRWMEMHFNGYNAYRHTPQMPTSYLCSLWVHVSGQLFVSFWLHYFVNFIIMYKLYLCDVYFQSGMGLYQYLVPYILCSCIYCVLFWLLEKYKMVLPFLLGFYFFMQMNIWNVFPTPSFS